MKQFFGTSNRGDLREAVNGLKSPEAILLLSNADQFEEHVAQLEDAFPGVPSIGCIDMCYDTKVVEKGVGVVAYEGVTAVAGVLEQVSTMPVKYIERFMKDVDKVKAGSNDTVCIDFCTGNDACVLTTIAGVLNNKRISLVGGTGDAGKVSVNGKVYSDADAYVLIKNNNGKVGVYKENIYRPMEEGYRMIASKTDRSSYTMGELNSKSAKQVYMDLLQIKEEDIGTQTFRNPFGRFNGQDVSIIAIKDVVGSALSCYRQINDSDVLTLLELKDYHEVVEETVSQIKNDFSHISGVFSINCLFRYLLFSQNKDVQKYLDAMGQLGNHVGMVGYGEHYNNQFLNQTMTCVVFE
ncbi:MAG: FIST C-terminal domain-containing protein [Lachnospiraceae bacterium]|nr:FIST C-terminal domain-containing protein [Lachnospiraceae bacterium]